MNTNTSTVLPSCPSAFPKKILLVASGMSPQVLTETLYALIHQEMPFVPDEVHMVTTTIGKNGAVSNLLAEGDGHFYRFCQDYHFPETAFTSDRIHVISDIDGKELADIVTKEDNESAADFITSLICQLTGDDNSSLHVSLAGGRKTMSYFTGYALSLYGRPQDRLSHVLVDADYEGQRDFYYPTPDSHIITNRDGTAFDASLAKVSLADIPFIRLRDDLPGPLIKGKQSFRETIETMRLIEEPLSLELIPDKLSIRCSGQTVKLTPANYFFYHWVYKHQSKCGEYLVRPIKIEEEFKDGDKVKTKGEIEMYPPFELIELRKEFDHLNATDEEHLSKGLSSTYFQDRISGATREITKVLGKRLASNYVLQGRGTGKVYINPELIHQMMGA